MLLPNSAPFWAKALVATLVGFVLVTGALWRRVRRHSLRLAQRCEGVEAGIRELSDASGAIVWQIDANGVFKNIYGWEGINYEIDPRDLLERNISVLADIYPEFVDLLQRGSRGTQLLEYGYFDDRLYQHNFSHWYGADGQKLGFQCVSTDVTEDSRLLDRLALAEQIFDKSPQGMLLVNRRHEVVNINAAFSDITGFIKSDICNSLWRTQLFGNVDIGFVKMLLSALKTSGSWAGEVLLRRRSQETFAAHMSVSHIYDLVGEVTHYSLQFVDISQLQQAKEELQYLATRDRLTDLPNRRLFYDRLTEAIARAKRNESEFALYWLDFDNFKLINDSFGQRFGDAVLGETASRISAAVRVSDTVARLGGDEFAVITENIHSANEVHSLARKILECFSEPFENGGKSLECTASVGVAIYPHDGKDLNTLTKKAADAKRTAKREGRNGYYCLQDEGKTQVSKRKFYASELRLALKRSQMELAYQPLFDIRERRVVGCETLLRWNHHSYGTIAPNDFLPLSEDAGLAVEFGYWTLEEALSQFSIWTHHGMMLDYVSINLALSQIEDPKFPEVIVDTLRHYSIQPSRLMLEIGESLAVNHPDKVDPFVNRLSTMGVRICVDGFGSTGSNAVYLKDLPVDAVKLDHPLLMRGAGNRQMVDLIQALAGIGDILQKRVIAVGVERTKQEEVLRQIGCNYAQGYLYGRPMSADFFGKAYAGAATGDAAH